MKHSRLIHLVDHGETYGPHVMSDFMRRAGEAKVVLDIGAGSGRDLELAEAVWPNAEFHAVEFVDRHVEALRSRGVSVTKTNVERDILPFRDGSVDFVIANQVLEHMKEVFWIFHEVSRVLPIGGHFLFGVPNVASLHNRFLLAAGVHPTQHKLASAHVRPFSRGDTLRFLRSTFPGGYKLSAFSGAQFYPLPRGLSRPLAKLFPGAAFSIFFMFKKVKHYSSEFLDFPSAEGPETNFWVGVKHMEDHEAY